MKANFDIELTDEMLCSHSGLLLVGQLLDSHHFTAQVSPLSQQKGDPVISDADILRSYLGLLCVGKNQYEAIDDYKADEYFKQAIGVNRLPSKETLRQRLEGLATDNVLTLLAQFNLQPVKTFGVFETALETEMVPVDFDVTPMDNSHSHKEGVSLTYKRYDGFAPMMTYIGGTGFLLNMDFREGKAHSNCEGTGDYIIQTISYAKTLTNSPLLARFDSGNDSTENIVRLSQEPGLDYIIKKNFRRERPDTFITYAREHATHTTTPRPGKRVYYASRVREVVYRAKDKPAQTATTRDVMRLIERTIDVHGQVLLLPTLDIEVWFTSLSPTTFPAVDVVALYADHGTSEQFHSEFKTDMDMERLPSGKFETNRLVMQLGVIAFNLLRIIGQESLQTGLVKRKRTVQRIRLRKVLQDIMYMACRYMIKCKRKTIKLSRHCAYSRVLIETYNHLLCT